MDIRIQDLVSFEIRRLNLIANKLSILKLTSYIELLCHWGKRINLTGTPEPLAVIYQQLPDAIVLSRHLKEEAKNGQKIVDIGTGAGIPGLVLSILSPELEVTLVETNNRKCSFLRTVNHELELNATIIEARIEDAKLAIHDWFCSRATWPIRRWLTIASSIAPIGKRIIAFPSETIDLFDAPKNLWLEHKIKYHLDSSKKRILLVYRHLS